MEVMQQSFGGGSARDVEDDMQYASHESLYRDPEEEAAHNHSLLYEEPIEYTGSIFGDDSEEEEEFLEADGSEKEVQDPIRGFDEEEKKICPLVDRKSAILFDIVQALEDKHISESIQILQKYKTPIVFPRELLEEGGSLITMRICEDDDNLREEIQQVEEPQEQVVSEMELSRPDEECIIEMELSEQQKLLGDPEYALATFTPPFRYGKDLSAVLILDFRGI